jgi:hypothetical protein
VEGALRRVRAERRREIWARLRIIFKLFMGLFILLCVAAVILPNVIAFHCRSEQSEAKVRLKSLAVAQLAFHEEHDRFSSSFRELGFDDERYRRRFMVFVAHADDEHFSAYALGKRDRVAGDVWRIDESLMLEHVEDTCP